MEDNQYIELQQEYLTAKAKLKQTEAEFERQKDLYQSSRRISGYQITLQALAEKLRLIAIDPQKLNPGNISRTIKLYAPFTGYVASMNMHAGKYAAPTDVLCELVNPEALWLNMKVFEKDIAALQTGQEVTAFTNSEPDNKNKGTIIFTGKTLNEDRSVEVHAELKNASGLIPGTYLNAEIAQNNTESKAVPEEALVTFEEKDFLFVARGKTSFELLPAETGATHQNWTEIKNTSAFKGKNIVTKGAYNLLMALKNTGEEE